MAARLLSTEEVSVKGSEIGNRGIDIPKSEAMNSHSSMLAEKDSLNFKDPMKGASGVPMTGVEQKFYKFFMDPMLSEMEETIRNNNKLLDDLSKKMEEDRVEMRKLHLSQHLPDVLRSSGLKLKEIMENLEKMILYENYDPTKDSDESTLAQAHLKHLDETSEAVILCHGLGAYVSTLEPQHLKSVARKVVEDTTTWLCKLFRFGDGQAHFHDDDHEGVVSACKMALHRKYPKLATDGYEAFYSRPPVVYVSAAAKHGLGEYICQQLGMPVSCLSVVPTSTRVKYLQKIDVAALEKMIRDGKAAGKMPVFLLAYAGTPGLGHVDNLIKLHDLCKEHDIWLHVEGNNLAGLAKYTVPDNVVPAKLADSMTLDIGRWLGLPGVTFATLYKNGSGDTPTLAKTAGLKGVNLKYKLTCLPLWVTLQNLGIEGVTKRINYTIDLARRMKKKVQKTSSLKDILFIEEENPTVVFRYVGNLEQPPDRSLDALTTMKSMTETAEGDTDEETDQETDPYFDALNIWLTETLRRDVPRVHISAINVHKVGICVRFAPMENANIFDTTPEDVEMFVSVLEKQISILNATIAQRLNFREIVGAQDHLQCVALQNWAGLGAVRYYPANWVDTKNNLTDLGRKEVNNLNMDLVHQLKSADTAFSLGQSDDEMVCVRFGLITDDTDLEELIGLVYATGKEIEESSKFVESMADVVRQGIVKANEDLMKENQERLMQEGVLRQMPLVGSLLNWWSPPAANHQSLKGRSFNLASGKIESTEKTYKFHMQIQESSAGVQGSGSQGGGVTATKGDHVTFKAGFKSPAAKELLFASNNVNHSDQRLITPPPTTSSNVLASGGVG